MADLNSEQLLDQMAFSCWKEEKAVHCHPPVRVGQLTSMKYRNSR